MVHIQSLAKKGGLASVVREMAEEGHKPEERTHRGCQGRLNHVEGSERGTTGQGTRRQKRARGAGLQGPTGTWGAGRGQKIQHVQDGWWRPAGMDACLVRRSKTGMRVEIWVQRAVQLSLRVTDGRRSRDTEGEGDVSRKQANGGTGF